jgi:hypothetical protein
MPQILLAHAEGEGSLADSVAGPLRAAGYDVLYEGTVLVGESLVQEASKALGAGSPVVLCGTVMALGTGWAHQVVNAARSYPGVRIFALQMEKLAYLQPLSLDGRVAAYWQDPGKAMSDLIDALREYYPPQASAEQSSADDLERRYRALALRTYDIVDLANLPVTDRNLATRELLLRSLYVGLRVSVDPVPGFSDALSGTGSRQRGVSSGGEASDAASRWPVGERLARSRTLVVLGDPGAGKSTLLRWLATAYLLRLNADPDWQELPDVAGLPGEDWLPILVRCRDLEEAQAAGSLEQILEHHLKKLGIASAEVAQLNEILLQRLSDGCALLLLDGLDEIAQPATRARFCRQVEQIHVTYPNAPIIATSRIVGYREMGLRIRRGFEHVIVLDLTAEDKNEFARRWCAVTEPIARRESAEEELVRDIHSTDRIERLTGNPMLLTTMALVKKKVGKLPSKRADLYREAVDVLLNWRSDVDELLDPHEAVPQLEYVAYAMCAAGVQQLRADEIVTLLGRMRKEFPSIRAARRHDSLEFLQLLERRTGVLVEIGRVRHKGQMVPAYEFRHLTFQEYLAGLALVEGRFPGRDRQLSLAENVAPLAAQTSQTMTRGAGKHNSPTVTESWREALRLCVMSCNDDDVDSVLLAMSEVRADEQASVTAWPRAVLAVSCLSDEPNVSEEIAIRLIDRFAELIPEMEEEEDPDIFQTAKGVATSLWGQLFARRLVMAWLSAPDYYTSLGSIAATAGAEHAPEDTDALRRWLIEETRKLSSADRIERICTALSVMEVAFGGSQLGGNAKSRRVPGLGPGLMAMLKRHGREADAAAWAIGWLARFDRDVSPIWKPSAKQASTLISCILDPRASAMTIRFLLWAVRGDHSPDRKFAEAVSIRIGNSSPDNAALIAESYARLFPAYADPIVTLAGHSSANVRVVTAGLLGRFEDSRASEALLALLSDPNDQVRDSATEALVKRGDTRAVESLVALKHAQNLTAPSVVVAGLAALGYESAIQEFQKLMKGPSSKDRRTALWALARWERDWADRILLSADADGVAPGVDPRVEIGIEDITRYAAATRLSPLEVRESYERLKGKYLLRLDLLDAAVE